MYPPTATVEADPTTPPYKTKFVSSFVFSFFLFPRWRPGNNPNSRIRPIVVPGPIETTRVDDEDDGEEDEDGDDFDSLFSFSRKSDGPSSTIEIESMSTRSNTTTAATAAEVAASFGAGIKA
jgi:hypothetical protein